MKITSCLIALLALLCLPVKAQTNTNSTPLVSGPLSDFISFATTEGATNWMAATYSIYDAGSKSFGGGAALAYRISDFVVPSMRLDYVDGGVWMPSANLQLQVPVTILGKFTTVPFTFAGIATPIAGQGSQNGTAVGMFGAGGAVRLGAHWDVIGDVEKWSGANFTGLQYRFGIVYKF